MLKHRRRRSLAVIFHDQFQHAAIRHDADACPAVGGGCFDRVAYQVSQGDVRLRRINLDPKFPVRFGTDQLNLAVFRVSLPCFRDFMHQLVH